MTREEWTNDVAIEYGKHISSDLIHSKAAAYDFAQGIKYADEHPQSPWISSKDRLPTGGGHYLCMDDNHNIAVLAFVGDKWINTKTFTDVPLEVVIYWMPIPELPK